MTVVGQPLTVSRRFHTTGTTSGTPRRRRVTRAASSCRQAPDLERRLLVRPVTGLAGQQREHDIGGGTGGSAGRWLPRAASGAAGGRRVAGTGDRQPGRRAGRGPGGRRGLGHARRRRCRGRPARPGRARRGLPRGGAAVCGRRRLAGRPGRRVLRRGLAANDARARPGQQPDDAQASHESEEPALPVGVGLTTPASATMCIRIHTFSIDRAIRSRPPTRRPPAPQCRL